MMFFFLVLVCGVAVVGCLFFGYHYVLQLRANSRRPHNVTVQFRRSSGISSSPSATSTDATSISPRRNRANVLRFEAQSPLARNGTAGVVVRNRNETRPSGVSFISPNSMYGYMPKANILNEANKPEKELKKEFTIKLAPFPALNRSGLMNNSPSMSTTLNSPRSPENNGGSFNSSSLNNNNNTNTPSFMMNGSIAHHQQQQSTTSGELQRPTPTVTTTSTPTSLTTTPRPSNKRPIFSNDSSEDESHFKKLKNQILDEIDLDDSDMFAEQTESTAPKKGAKRPTQPFENDIHLNSPLKRVKNNEILSSYSSTSVSSESRSMLNKRKFQHSPEESTNSFSSTKVLKKRTHIEELELLTSDQSPYYRNIYNNTVSTGTTDSTPTTASTTTQPKRTLLPSLLPSSLITSSEQSHQQNYKFSVPTTNGQLNSDNLTTSTTVSAEEPDVIELIDDSDDDDDDDDDDISLNTDASAPVAEEDNELEGKGAPEIANDQSPTPQISEQVFSIKDHEYDKKKSKDRLNRFLAAVQQGSDSTTVPEKNRPDSLVNSSSTTVPLLSISKMTNGTIGSTKAKTKTITSSTPIIPVSLATNFNFAASATTANGNGIITFGAKPKPIEPLTTTIELVKDTPPTSSESSSKAAPQPPVNNTHQSPFVPTPSITV